MPNRLLLIDGDPRSLRVLDVSLRREGFDVDTATSGSDAWAMLETSVPDLIIADAGLSGIDGFELCARLRRSSFGAALPIILLAADRALDQKVRSVEVGADDYLIKPAYIGEVVSRVRALLQRRDRDRWGGSGKEIDGGAPPPGSGEGPGSAASPTSRDRFSGDLASSTVVDLIQLMDTSKRSGIAHLRGPGGAPASIYFRQGRVVDAEAGRLSGTAAVNRLFAWATGTFDVEWRNIRRTDVVDRAPAELVLEGMRGLDAWNELTGQLNDTEAVLDVDYRLLAERLAEIPDEVNSILRLCDGVRPIRQVVEESAMADVDALTALIRLRDEGIVYDRASGRVATHAGELAPGDGRPDGRSSPFTDGAYGGTRPIRSGVGSGAVQRSFTERLEAEARRRSDAVAAAPVVTAGVDASPPSADQARAMGKRHRTAPGLGQASPKGASPSATDDDAVRAPNAAQPRAEDDGMGAGKARAAEARRREEAAVPEPRVEQANVIRFPVPAPSAAARALGRNSPFGRAGEIGADRPAAGAVTAAAVPMSPASMSETNRGFGPPSPTPAPGEPVWANDRPISEEEGATQFSGRVMETQPADGEPLTFEASSGGVRAAPVAASAPSPAAAHGQSGRSPSAPPPDQTVRMSFAADDINRHDAIDELGLPSRWRGAKFLMAALVVGAASAVTVHQFRRLSAPEAKPVEIAARRPAGTAAPEVALPSPGAPGKSAHDHAGDTVAEAAKAALALTTPEGEHGGGSAKMAPAPTAAEGEHGGGSAKAVHPGEAGNAERPAQPLREPGNEIARPQPEKEPGARASEPGGSPQRAAAPPSLDVGRPASAPLIAPVTPPDVAARAAPPSPDPAPPSVAQLLADCRVAFARNRIRDAVAACTASVDASPDSAEALTLLAHTELNRGHMSRASAYAARAIKADPSMADAYVIIGGVRQDSGQNREAKEAYRRYLQLAPRGRYADELRSIVNSL